MTVLAGSKQQSSIVLKKLLHFHLMPKHTAERAETEPREDPRDSPSTGAHTFLTAQLRVKYSNI